MFNQNGDSSLEETKRTVLVASDREKQNNMLRQQDDGDGPEGSTLPPWILRGKTTCSVGKMTGTDLKVRPLAVKIKKMKLAISYSPRRPPSKYHQRTRA